MSHDPRRDLDVHVLGPPDASTFQALRLRGLRECPTAFASSAEEEESRTIDEVASRLVAGLGAAVLGAFDGTALVGVAGLYREHHTKLAHKATLWGMYVAPEARRGGVGRLLVERALDHAFGPMGLRQVNLGVNAANRPAIALYEAAGFRTFGVERGFMVVDGVLQDELQMVCVRRGAAVAAPSAGGRAVLATPIPIVRVSDGARAEEFYAGRLGFRVEFRYRADPARPDPSYRGVSRDGAWLHLSSFGGDGVFGESVYLPVDDVDRLFEELRERGVAVDLAPTDQTWNQREMYVRDPDGNCLRFATELRRGGGDGGAR